MMSAGFRAVLTGTARGSFEADGRSGMTAGGTRHFLVAAVMQDSRLRRVTRLVPGPSESGIGDRSIAAAAAATVAATTATTATAPTAVTTTAAAVTTAATTTVAAATAAWFTGPSLVDGQPAAVDLLVMERLDRRLCFLIAAHLHEAEALAAAGVAVVDDLDALHAPELREQLLQFGVADLVGQVPDIKFLAHRPLQDTEVGDPSRVSGV